MPVLPCPANVVSCQEGVPCGPVTGSFLVTDYYKTP